MIFLFNIILVIFSTASFGFSLEQSELLGGWFRTIEAYKAWSDDNQGTFSTFQENITFNQDGTYCVLDGSTGEVKDKNKYALLTKDTNSFIVFYNDSDNPEDPTVQEKKGFYISLIKDSKNIDTIVLIPQKEFLKEQKQKKKKKQENIGITYTRLVNKK
ncbi:MAG: hypothetical protein ACRCTQ_01165 [Brevinemataceae bacterium]